MTFRVTGHAAVLNKVPGTDKKCQLNRSTPGAAADGPGRRVRATISRANRRWHSWESVAALLDQHIMLERCRPLSAPGDDSGRHSTSEDSCISRRHIPCNAEKRLALLSVHEKAGNVAIRHGTSSDFGAAIARRFVEDGTRRLRLNPSASTRLLEENERGIG